MNRRGLILGLIAGIGFAFFVAVGIHHWVVGPSVPRSPAEIAAEQERQQLRFAEAEARRLEAELKLRGPCDKVKREYYFAPNPDPNQPANPQGQCRLVAELPEGRCVYVEPAVFKVAGLGKAPTQGPFGECPTSKGVSSFDPEYIWAAGAGFWGFITLEPG